ncbi:DEAD-domain-containing protein [Calocera cornea HHB12733]|uniref:ATP-dependent RNA helicase n=1 Tax=Calocera cornea HHB12733 TaxID=1353952 RepID=A0A165I1T0_9BASI|nr:DEAD-domain-containing protein [Calocera cornea HHB12733]
MPSVANNAGPSSTPAAQRQGKGKGKGKEKGQDAEKRQKMLHAKHRRRHAEDRAFAALEQAVADFDPEKAETFADFPLSAPTQRGLKQASYTRPTDIQARTLAHTLRGGDVLGAARTGSGKTLAFLLPVLELLWRRRWGPQDGLGALVISPTRELAMQIFDVLRSVGQYHSFSAGLVIGGKNVKDEQDRLGRMNILVATPGRLLQHMDQTAGFDADHLQVLVLDEADRILDMGFSRTLNALLAHLPKSRQSLLFSATQTQSVKDLARLSLKDPQYIAVREAGHEGATPRSLEQHYLVCELDRKLDVLWSFVKAHLKAKVLVFMSSGKQVRFVYEAFRKLQPGIPLLHLLGKQKLTKRLDIFQRFTSTTHAVLFATDIAARGLDFPAVDWVVQLDAPEDAETYIHRVGRTARYDAAGRALLFLLPSEERGMLAELAKKEVTVAKIKVRESKTQSVAQSLQSFCFQDPEIKYLGQRAFVSYLRSVHLHANKDVFRLADLPIKRFAKSLGLPGAPRIRFGKAGAEEAKGRKNASRVLGVGEGGKGDADADADEDEDGEDVGDASGADSGEEDDADLADAKAEFAAAAAAAPAVRTKYDRMFERKNQNILSSHYTKLIAHDVDGDLNEAEDFITLKRVDHSLDDGGSGEGAQYELSKRKTRIGQSRKAMLKYKPAAGTKLVFDEEGEAHPAFEIADDDEFRRGDVRAAGQEFATREREQLRVVDREDKEVAREKKKEKKRKRKEREREMLDGEKGAGPVVALGEEGGDDDGYVSPDFGFIGDEEEEGEREAPPAKRRKKARHNAEAEAEAEGGDLAAQEALALQLLQQGL